MPSQRNLELIGVKPTTEEVAHELTVREAALPPSLRELRQKLGRKAKQQKQYRFYSLYGLVCREDVLRAAVAAVRRNNGAPGVDGMRVAEVFGDEARENAFIGELQQSLKERTYRAQSVRRVYILKANGKLRPLGIPTVRDRVVQAAVLLVLEPIFEADFQDCSYGFRPGRSAHDALKVIQRHLGEGKTVAYDADLASYFDTIPHEKLMACVRMRVMDGSVLRLIKQWLEAPVVEPSDKEGAPTVRRNNKGTPQGGVISPLLANIYLHWFDHVFMRADGPVEWANARLARYADDFVVLARWMSPQLQHWIEDKLEGWLGLKINREKTRVVKLQEPGASLDFLGYTFSYHRDQYGRDQRYLTLHPSAKAMMRERDALRQRINAKQCCTPLPELILTLNRHLRGWANYFQLGHSRKQFRALNHFVRYRLGRHLQRRSQRGWRPRKGATLYSHLEHMGLLAL
jgi:RNA-directed DNA polymerase